MMPPIKDRLILSLCDLSGGWSQPYREAGYPVLQMDLQLNPLDDIRLLRQFKLSTVWGILAAPPCTVFSKAGAQYWATMPQEQLLEGLSVVDSVIRIAHANNPAWWVLENPAGRLSDYLGTAQYWFRPVDYGDSGTKLTYLWGRFSAPLPTGARAAGSLKIQEVSRRQSFGGNSDIRRQNARSVTPAGFAQAFFECNP